MTKAKLFYNGTIITMDEKNNIFNSVYVDDGIIKALGNYTDLRKKYPNCELVDLEGKVMLPGFIEPHAHFDLCSMVSKMASASGIEFETTERVLEHIKKVIKETPKGKWLMFFGLDYLINRDLPEMNRHFLDKLSTEHPITLIIQSMHTIYCNSLALEKVGITRETKDNRDGYCIKDKDGEPLGILTEQGFLIPFVKLWLKDLNLEPHKLLEDESQLWKKFGVTTVWTAGYFPLYPDHFKIMCDFFNREETPLRGDYSLSFNSIESNAVTDADLERKPTLKAKMTGIKSWYDGSPYTGNMFMYDNYLENDTMQKKLYIPAHQCGERLFRQDFFYKMLKKYHDAGYQLSIHGQGDRACHEILTILERILKENPRKDHRHRLEHCAFIRKEDVELAAKLGVTISFHTNHIYYYGEALRDLVIGKERTEKILPCKSAINAGMKISLHSDAPMYTPNPLRVAGGAVTRKTRAGLVIGKDEALTVTEALRGITIDAAWQLFRENEIGSIEIGKLADFTVIEENPYDVLPEHIKDIKVVTTYLSGVDTKTMTFKK